MTLPTRRAFFAGSVATAAVATSALGTAVMLGASPAQAANPKNKS